MQLNYLKGYPDRIGKRFAWCGYGTGPKSYVGGVTGGDPIMLPSFDNYVDTVESSGILDLSGLYIVFFYPSLVGPRPTWYGRWFNFTTSGVERGDERDEFINQEHPDQRTRRSVLGSPVLSGRAEDKGLDLRSGSGLFFQVKNYTEGVWQKHESSRHNTTEPKAKRERSSPNG